MERIILYAETLCTTAPVWKSPKQTPTESRSCVNKSQYAKAKAGLAQLGSHKAKCILSVINYGLPGVQPLPTFPGFHSAEQKKRSFLSECQWDAPHNCGRVCSAWWFVCYAPFDKQCLPIVQTMTPTRELQSSVLILIRLTNLLISVCKKKKRKKKIKGFPSAWKLSVKGK